MRVFVAIDVPGTAAAAGRERGSAPEHLTLAFLGDVDEERVPAIERALADVAGRTEAFALTVSGVGGFPDIERPRIVYAEVADGRAATERLASDVRSALAPLGFPPEARPFVPHVTLLRVRSPRDRERARWLVRELAGRTLATTVIEAVVLKSSDLRPEGAVHRIVGRWELRPASGRGRSP